MMNDAKENYVGLSCKSNTARTEKGNGSDLKLCYLYRICPSKLSKHELEDLYFALLEQNVQLKKTINEQRDQIKVLNTRVQRMTVQKPMSGFHNKDCCSGTKAIINEQKESIADLKKANERLSERLRLLNMRLCSAKQFLKRGSSQAASHLSKCLVSSDSIKNLSMSALNTKRSNSKSGRGSSPFQIDKNNIKIQLPEIDVPSQLAEINMPSQSAETTSSRTDTPSNRPYREGPCQRNECRTEMDELKLKIVALEEAVLSVRQSHSQRMCALEAAQAQCGARRHTDELSSQLQQQLARVSDLRSSRHVDNTTDADTTNHTLPRTSLTFSPEARVSDPPVPGVSERKNSPPIVVPNNSGISIFIEEKCHKNSDDSGFTDCKNNDLKGEKERTLQEQDDLIENQIANIQSQLLNLKMNAATEVGPQVEAPAIALEAESSLSHNIFSTSKLKTMTKFDKVPSTSHEPDVLVSMEGIYDELPHGSEKTQKYGPDLKYNTPAPPSLDMPKIYLGDTVTDLKILENGVTDNHSEDSKRSKGNFKTNSENMYRKKQEMVVRDKNSIIDSLDKSNQIIQEIIEEGKTNDTNKNNRRSSLKSSYEGKHYKDLGVRYESSSKSETNLRNVPQGTEIEKVYIEPDNNYVSEPSVQYKINGRGSIRRIRYTSDVRTGPCTARQIKPIGIDSAVTANGTGRAEQDVGIQCLRDDTPKDSCDGEQIASYGPNGALVKGTVVNDGLNGPVLCGGLSRVCECSPASAPGRVFLRSCSGAPTSQIACGERYRACACGHDLRLALSSPEPSRCLAEPPEASSERHNSSESSCFPAKPRLSVERPDREGSSLTDSRRTHETRPSDCVSPGEEKSTYTLSDSYATTEGGSLSEGEVPVSGGKRLPATVDNMTEPIRSSRSEKMEDALRTISQELRRCRELLQRSGEKVREEGGESS